MKYNLKDNYKFLALLYMAKIKLFPRKMYIFIFLCLFVFVNCDNNHCGKIPVIFITDLYHPCQDPGDNVDIIIPYALPEVDLKAVILDVTDEYRQPICPNNDKGPREPGFIPLAQLNYIFNKDVPCAVGPFCKMNNENDKMEDIPGFQQTGIDLLFKTLENSKEKVDIVITGSARILAVAYNRNPKLLYKKINRVHLCAGSSSPKFQEWNVVLDPYAIFKLLNTKLPIIIYPCATEKGPFDKGKNNSFWKLGNLDFIKNVNPKLQNYLYYVFSKSSRIDFLRAMDEPPVLQDSTFYSRPHNVWETAVWQQIINRSLVKKANGLCEIIPNSQINDNDSTFYEAVVPCKITVFKNGTFEFEKTGESNFYIYERDDPVKYERWMQDAFSSLFSSIEVK